MISSQHAVADDAAFRYWRQVMRDGHERRLCASDTSHKLPLASKSHATPLYYVIAMTDFDASSMIRAYLRERHAMPEGR